MAKKFYQVLEASETASQDTLHVLFEQKRVRLQLELDNGNPSAKEQLWSLKQAYDTLSNPEKRAAYDRPLSAEKVGPTSRRAVAQKPEGISWKTSAILLALMASGMVGFGLHLGRENKKDAHAAQVLQTMRSTDNDAARATTERVLVEGVIRNDEKLIDTHGQVANRVVSVQESAESRASRELEYRANAGTEQLRQQQERIRIGNEQLQWERRQHEQAQAMRQAQTRIASDRLQTIQLMVADGRFGEARGYATTTQERAIIADAERAQNSRR